MQCRDWPLSWCVWLRGAACSITVELKANNINDA